MRSHPHTHTHSCLHAPGGRAGPTSPLATRCSEAARRRRRKRRCRRRLLVARSSGHWRRSTVRRVALRSRAGVRNATASLRQHTGAAGRAGLQNETRAPPRHSPRAPAPHRPHICRTPSIAHKLVRAARTPQKQPVCVRSGLLGYTRKRTDSAYRPHRIVRRILNAEILESSGTRRRTRARERGSDRAGALGRALVRCRCVFGLGHGWGRQAADCCCCPTRRVGVYAHFPLGRG